MRLNDDLQAFLVVPWVYRSNGGGRVDTNRAGVGDVIVGATYQLVETMFRDDWYPSITVTGGAKLPTGSVDTKVDGRFTPGTGNGVWEPFVGVGFEKPIGLPTLALKATFTGRMGARGLGIGNMFELTGTVSLPFTQRFNFGAGVTQAWIFKDGQRVASVFVTPTYYLTRFWSLAASAELAVPIAGFGVNQQMPRSVTLTAKYAFF